MTKNPVSTLKQKKDRRGLLALIGAGGAAAVAALLSRSNGAQALGPTYHESSTSTPAVHGNNTDTGPGVQGESSIVGVYGYSDTGRGVYGWSNDGYGVKGSSSNGYALYGDSNSSDGVRGRRITTSGTGAGVQGFSGVNETDASERVGVRGSGADVGVRGEGGGTGVTGLGSDYGVSGGSSSGTGVFGGTQTGTAVFGSSGSGTGVRGFCGGGVGVRGEGSTGVVGKATSGAGVGLYGNAASGSVGVRAEASGTKAALHVKGRSRFKQSGKTTVSAGAYSKVVPLTFTLAPGSLVVATLQGNAGTGVAVRTASKYGSNKIRITLTKKATNSATIAYFIFTP